MGAKSLDTPRCQTKRLDSRAVIGRCYSSDRSQAWIRVGRRNAQTPTWIRFAHSDRPLRRRNPPCLFRWLAMTHGPCPARHRASISPATRAARPGTRPARPISRRATWRPATRSLIPATASSTPSPARKTLTVRLPTSAAFPASGANIAGRGSPWAASMAAQTVRGARPASRTSALGARATR